MCLCVNELCEGLSNEALNFNYFNWNSKIMVIFYSKRHYFKALGRLSTEIKFVAVLLPMSFDICMSIFLAPFYKNWIFSGCQNLYAVAKPRLRIIALRSCHLLLRFPSSRHLVAFCRRTHHVLKSFLTHIHLYMCVCRAGTPARISRQNVTRSKKDTEVHL